MQSILCDICKAEIRETAQELLRVTGTVASTLDTGARIVNRQAMSMHMLCDGCAGWLVGAQAHLVDYFAASAGGRAQAG
jgi:hypothetical protein